VGIFRKLRFQVIDNNLNSTSLAPRRSKLNCRNQVFTAQNRAAYQIRFRSLIDSYLVEHSAESWAVANPSFRLGGAFDFFITPDQ